MGKARKVAIGAAGAVVLFVVLGATLPRKATVERTIQIDTPPAVVFTVLNGFRQFARWSPWAERDPDAITEIEGPALGVGARMTWAGNDDVGRGSQEIVESRPYEHIAVRLTFDDFTGDFRSRYALAREGTGTRVTWTFDADYGGNLVGRYFGLFSEAMIGADYEDGLARLKDLAEALPRVDFGGLAIDVAESAGEPIVRTATRSANNAAAIGVALGVAYSRLSGYISVQGLRQIAPPVAIYHGEEDGVVSFEAAIPVDRMASAPSGTIRPGHLRPGRVVRAIYRGPYPGLAAANGQVRAFLAAAGFQQDGPAWEQYVSDPGHTPADETVTHIHYPVK